MSRCAKCGTANPPDVAECLYCGETLREAQPVRDEKRHAALLPRLLVSLAMGLLVTGISCHVAYQQFRDPGLIIRDHQRYTLRSIGVVEEAIDAYAQEKQVLPSSLRDLSLPEDAYVGTDKTGVPLDRWDRPLQYATNGSDYGVTSYGRDGQPGGVGLDYDLSRDDLPKDSSRHASTSPWSWKLPQRSTPTFWQFVSDRGEFANTGAGGMMALLSVLAGAVAFVLGFRTLGRSEPGRPSTWRLVLNLVVTTGATLLIGLLIVGFHVPSGH